MSHKLFYVYEIKGDINELNKSNNSPIEIDGTQFSLCLKQPKHVDSIIPHYYFEDQEEIKGHVLFKNRKVLFKIRSKSKLLFVETKYQREKLIIPKFFNNKFKNFEIESFTPTDEEEKEFVCKTAKYSSFKVFIDDKVIHSEETNRDLCKGLMEDMELIEATLDITIQNEEITFYYYGNAIQFPHLEDYEIEGVIQAFENTMSAPAK